MKENKRREHVVNIENSIALLGIVLLAIGCAKSEKWILGVPNTQLLEKDLPQSFTLELSAEKSWNSIRTEIINDPNSRILAEEPEAYLISWVQPDEEWRDLSQDVIAYAGMFGRPTPSKKVKRAPVKGIAVTTVWSERAISGCKMHIRRVYYGPNTFSGVADSRGDYEHNLADNLKRFEERISSKMGEEED